MVDSRTIFILERVCKQGRGFGVSKSKEAAAAEPLWRGTTDSALPGCSL